MSNSSINGKRMLKKDEQRYGRRQKLTDYPQRKRLKYPEKKLKKGGEKKVFLDF